MTQAQYHHWLFHVMVLSVPLGSPPAQAAPEPSPEGAWAQAHLQAREEPHQALNQA